MERSRDGYYILGPGHIIVPSNILDYSNWRMSRDGSAHSVVRQEMITDHIMVSTIFLGLDHNLLRDGTPILFETMVFDGDKRDQYRYFTWDEALAGHNAIVEQLRARSCSC